MDGEITSTEQELDTKNGVRRDIIVIGASAGGLRALKELTRHLPSNLNASLFVVQHIPASARSQLPDILTGSGPLPAVHPASGQHIEPGMIYVAPPDHHLIVEYREVQLWRGPRENYNRPAINPLFRSAAVAYRERVTGVILSGALDDGVSGLWWVKKYGGMTIVQDPKRAQFPQMPNNAMKHVDIDFIAAESEIGLLLGQLAAGVSV